MGNCATVQVGAYVESCAGKPCSSVCPTGSCPNGWICNSGVCNAPYVETADCSISTNYCTPSCLDKASCVQCPNKDGCGETVDVRGCNQPCPDGSICNETLHQCIPITINPNIDIYGCDTSVGSTWCAARNSCHIESTDPCRPIMPVTPPGEPTPPPPGVVTPQPTPAPTETPTDDIMGFPPQTLLLLGLALMGGFVMMSSRK